MPETPLTKTVDGQRVTIPPAEAAALRAQWSVTPTQEEIDAANTLTPRQFGWLLAINGWDDVWQAVKTAAKTSDTDFYAKLVAQERAGAYLLSETLGFLSNAVVQSIAGANAPSEATVRAKWEEAKSASLDAGS